MAIHSRHGKQYILTTVLIHIHSAILYVWQTIHCSNSGYSHSFNITLGIVSITINTEQQGFKGIKGEEGEDGISWIPGPAGEPGRAGEKGDPGVDGIPGSKGYFGQPGSPGIRGPKGAPGDQGYSGRKVRPTVTTCCFHNKYFLLILRI